MHHRWPPIALSDPVEESHLTNQAGCQARRAREETSLRRDKSVYYRRRAALSSGSSPSFHSFLRPELIMASMPHERVREICSSPVQRKVHGRSSQTHKTRTPWASRQCLPPLASQGFLSNSVRTQGLSRWPLMTTRIQ